MTRTVLDANNLFADNYGASVVEADGDGDSAVRLQGCTFSGKPPGDILPRLLADNRGTDGVAEFFSDSEVPEVCTFEGDDPSTTPPLCEISVPKQLDATEGFLNRSSGWLVETQKVRYSLYAIAMHWLRKLTAAALQYASQVLPYES